MGAVRLLVVDFAAPSAAGLSVDVDDSTMLAEARALAAVGSG